MRSLRNFKPSHPQLIYKFIQQTLQPGPPVSLKCIATGNPTPHISWKLDGYPLAGDRHENKNRIGEASPNRGVQQLPLNRRQKVFPNGTLLIENVQKDHDRGVYWCTATNKQGRSSSQNVHISVTGAPFVRPMGNVSAIAGEPLYLGCPVAGYPIESITWQKGVQQLPLNRRQKVFPNGTLLIENVQKDHDRGVYWCTATNKQGRSSSQNVHISVTVPPKIAPFEFQPDLHSGDRAGVQCLVTKGDPPLTISWLKNGLPILSAMVDVEWKSQNSGTEQWAVLQDLLPATLYRVRVLAENSLGAGRPSDPLLVHTEAEPPTAEPSGLHAVAISSDSIRVTWSPPPAHLTNGDLLGYYLGYREQGFGRQNSYNFTTIPNRSDGAGVATLTGLRKYRKYDIVVQAFNEKGPGPMSSEVSVQTLEDVPAAPPLDITCSALSSTSLSVTWQPPPLLLQNGEILGYKVYYENMRELPMENIETGVKQSKETKISLKGLHKYCNYSIHIWAFTRVGEGVRSKPVHCFTAEDVPEAPAGIKVHSNSPLSLMLSWRPPLRSNGIITSYTVYSKSLQVKRLPPTHTHTQLSDLRKGDTHEFWVTASTSVGEGPSTDVVKAIVSSKPKYPAAIISFGEVISIKSRQSISLRCLSVGSPAPKRSWHKSDAKSLFAIQADGSLEISSIEPSHSGNYTCSVSNNLGSDSITYSLLVLMPPSAVILQLVDKGSSWLDLEWRVENNGGSPIRGFILKFKRSDLADWNDITLPRDMHSYKLKDLICGKEYDVEVSSYNSVGTGEPAKSPPLQTQGGKPLRPSAHQLIVSNTTSFLLDLNTWLDNGCRISSFSIEYREVTRSEWITVGNDLQIREKIAIAGLWPGTDYVLRVKASNSAGVTKAEYPVSTTPLLVGEIPSSSDFLDNSGVVYSSLLPLTVVLIVILLCILSSLLLYIKKRKRGEILTGDSGDEDNKRNLNQREQYYAAALQTTTTTTPISQQGTLGYDLYENDATRWDFPAKSNSFQNKNSDDVSPYATFQIANADVRSFIHHEHKLASMDTLPLKSGNVYERDKYKMKVRKSSKSSVPPDYEDWSRQARVSVQSAESSTSPEASPRCLRHRTDVRQLIVFRSPFPIF
ncbi:Down syndrome cell adhesion molecule-like protein Dscam2 [Diaphorina citri]|uniref:Down syndrome cell adhesion molecule-like protein Dscam2 n=1 Tax=Diaphorina citri TaxID=121845 RepID=A0A3Q0IL91_DIACI|nr:Down syndrome cell adhesion molecule-like protein Dscam2 [Diaphorina citri]